MSLTTATGIALILSTLIYHGDLAYLFARSEFGDLLEAPQREKLLIVARHPTDYRRGCRLNRPSGSRASGQEEQKAA